MLPTYLLAQALKCYHHNWFRGVDWRLSCKSIDVCDQIWFLTSISWQCQKMDSQHTLWISLNILFMKFFLEDDYKVLWNWHEFNVVYKNTEKRDFNEISVNNHVRFHIRSSFESCWWLMLNISIEFLVWFFRLTFNVISSVHAMYSRKFLCTA